MSTTLDSGLVAVRLGPLRGPVEAVCKKRKIPKSEFLRDSIKVALEAEPSYRVRIFLGFLTYSWTMFRLASHYGILPRKSAISFTRQLDQLIEEVEKKLPSEAKPKSSRVFPSLRHRPDPILHEALHGLRQLVMRF